MPWPILARGALAAAGALARSGVIRGTAGRMLGGGARQLPRVLPGGAVLAGGGRGSLIRKGAGIVAAGAGIELGARGVRGLFGGKKKYRRMNPTNFKALSRALRRVEKFEKVVKKAFVVKDIKPRKRSCR